jgi:hypothetical protein
MKIKGIIQGKTIHLSEEITAPDGTEVIVEIPDHFLTNKIEQWQQLQEVIGSWKDDPEFAQQMELAETVMREDRNVLRKLAE